MSIAPARLAASHDVAKVFSNVIPASSAPRTLTKTSDEAAGESPRESNFLPWLTEGREHAALTVVAFLIPLKLSWTYGALITFSILWGLKHHRRIFCILRESREISGPWILFLTVAASGSFFGLNPYWSLNELYSLAYSSTLGVVTFDLCKRGLRPSRLVTALLAGQSIAALHSVLDSSFPGLIRPLFIGKLTESGQLALTIPLALGLFALELSRVRTALVGITGLLMNGFLLVLLGFWSFLPTNSISLALVWTGAGLFLVATLAYGLLHKGTSKRALVIGGVVVPLLLVALLVNLKRGPWAGVYVASLILLFMYSRKLVIPVLALSLAMVFAIAPIRDRLEQSSQHFYIPGGRSEIWSIGIELLSRYPLGIGYRNGAFLQKFSPRIPAELRHFHSNILNVVIETGWFGLLAFLWWYASVLLLSRRAVIGGQIQRAINAGIICGLISWQVAGVVEYNMGDREVLFVVFLLIGILMATTESATTKRLTRDL